MFRRIAPLPAPAVIDSSDYMAMQVLLEEKVREISRLQRQIEDFQHSLRAFIPADSSPIDVNGPSFQQTSQAYATGVQPHSFVREPDGVSGDSRAMPRRITVSLNDHVHKRLIERSKVEGRSISNLAAFILEAYLELPHLPH